jgi:hypothetical protein
MKFPSSTEEGFLGSFRLATPGLSLLAYFWLPASCF